MCLIHHSQFHHLCPAQIWPSSATKPQRSPNQHRDIIYGASIQNPLEEDTSPSLDAAGIKRIQGIVGKLLYHARSVKKKLLTTLRYIGSEQAKAIQANNKAANHLLN